ncbi:hypothetical protein [Ochrobactrum sp. BTU2]|jgi:hypothetical protein|uniref:hypothetical protein n=1 Tax=Brucella/Ochrobactrum group TaxID=2826938 RepID=UPI00211A16A4|nr:hypothetical protein [Ochrobactrum sp. BTU2]MCQ9147670.1 hypothetical protein [Ochrobactrum sp. BTU2]MCR5943639.1 hypothetical protein [Ochrobactrum sp. XJ1]
MNIEIMEYFWSRQGILLLLSRSLLSPYFKLSKLDGASRHLVARIQDSFKWNIRQLVIAQQFHKHGYAGRNLGVERDRIACRRFVLVQDIVILTLGNVTASAATGKCTSLALITGLEKREPTRLGIATQL